MLSKHVVQFIQNRVHPLVSLQVLPFGWNTQYSNSNQSLLRIKSEFKELIPMYTLTLIDILFLLPTFVFMPIACIENAQNITKIVIPISSLLCGIVALVVRINLYIFCQDITTIINKFLDYEVSQRKFMSK